MNTSLLRLNSSLLRLERVTRRCGPGIAESNSISSIDLHVDRGELVAIMGATLAQSSTLLAIAGGLAVPASGEVTLDGYRISQLSPRRLADLRRHTLGYVSQGSNLVPALTVLENVTLALEFNAWHSRSARAAAFDALGVVELGDRAHHYPSDLSDGQQQRVAIARALVGGRSLILADDPAGALDSNTGESILRMLRARVDGGAGALLMTHEPRHAAWADRIIMLRDGRIVDESTVIGPEKLLA